MEYLITDANERMAIPDVVVSASVGRELVAQYCAADAAGRASIEAQAKHTLGEAADVPTVPAVSTPIAEDDTE